jgi:hypothetical protein
MKHIMHTRLLAATLLLSAMVLPGAVQALAIGPGDDWFSTPDDSVFLDLDFTQFGAGIVNVGFKGNPLDPGTMGSTDTIVRRHTGLGDGDTGRIDIELVALSLVSVAPVEIPNPGGPSSFFDVFIDLDTDQSSTGHIDIIQHGPNGGLFDSFFDVFTEISVVPVAGGQPVAVIQQHDTQESTNSAWCHQPGPGTLFPNNNGGFFPGVDCANGPPVVVGVTHTGPHPKTMPTPTSVPEPSPVLLFGLGLGLLGWFARRSQRA